MQSAIKHVFFDLDHTLWDFDKNSALTFDKIFRDHGIALNLEDFLKVYEPINRKYWKRYREERVSKSELRYGRLKETFEALNLDVKDNMINQLSVAYINDLTSFNYLFEGTALILNYLNNKYTLHIITNGFAEAQERKLRNANIGCFFKTVTNSEMVGVKKPNPKIFHFALGKAKAKAEESVMIGDSLEADIEGARNVGMNTIFFDYKHLNKTYDFVRITKLEDIKHYL